MFEITIKIFLGLFSLIYRGMMAVLNSIISLINGYTLNKTNKLKRGITEYQPSNIEGFFQPASPITNGVYSETQTAKATGEVSYK